MNEKRSKILIIITIVTSVIYLTWRSFFTLPFGFGAFSIIAGIILLLAEISGVLEMILHFWSMSDVKKHKRPSANLDDFPTVDVFIATYNESTELLYKTINGCIHMKYPDKSKVSIYLCDDGNRSEIQKLAQHFGIGYLARENHDGAKAGNLNHALAHTNGELIVTFDADMIPRSNFLMRTVPYFIADLKRKKQMESISSESSHAREDKIGFVQAPQSFYNLDLFQYNLYSEESIPNEQDYFYKNIQLSKNKTNSVIYGGSNTVLSREALEEIGGFVTNVITEDFATGLLIESKGYTAIAIDEVLASGLSPEDIESLVKQRRRWARGCIQTGRRLHIMFIKGLNIKQKVSYLYSIAYWYDSIKRLIYMLAPIMYAVFGITVLKANTLSLIVFWLPMYLATSTTVRKLSGNIRTLRWTNIYETIMFPFLVKDIILEMMGISQHKFDVTKKEKTERNQRYQRKMAIPHAILALLTFYGLLNSIYSIFSTGSVSLLFLMFWLGNNLYILIMSLFFMLGRPAVRQHMRFAIQVPLTISYEQNKPYQIQTYTKDISEGGFSFVVKCPVYLPIEEEFDVILADGPYQTACKAVIVQVSDTGEGYQYSCRFTTITEAQYQQLLNILHDRVPPLTMQVDTECGFVEDLRTNVMRRRVQSIPMNRKLPRIWLNEKIVLSNQSTAVITSFNFRYITLKLEDNRIDPDLEEVKISDEITLVLKFERVLSYGQSKSGLYLIENYMSVLNSPSLLPWLFQATAANEEKKEEIVSSYSLNKNQTKYMEFDELQQ